MADTDTQTETRTLTELRDERARVATEMDEIVRTASDAERELTDDERARFDSLDGDFETLTGSIQRAETLDGDVRRSDRAAEINRMAVPNINRIGQAPAAEGRDLDELLWATSETVPAGSMSRSGQFMPSPYGARNPVEPVVVRSDSNAVAYAPRIDEFQPDHRGTIRRFQQTVADMALFGLLVDKQAKTGSQGFEVARAHNLMRDRWASICRAMDVDTSGEGGTWVPTGIGASLHEKIRALGKVAPLFGRIDLPTNPWKWPIEGADSTAYRVAEPTGDTETKVTASTPGTVSATFDAEIFGGRTLFSRSIEADSALAILPYVQSKLAKAFVIAEEKAILDGDTDGSHQDSDVGASTTDARTAWDGLRKRALANTGASASNAVATLALFRTARAGMGKWGINPADLAIIVPTKVYYQLLNLSEVTTIDKFGPQATVLNGQLGSLDGIPVIVTENGREDLNASGVYDGTTTNRTFLLIVNRGEWVMGQRMALDVEVDDSIYRETYQRVVVGFMREDFQNIGDASTNDDTAVLYNVA